MSKKKTPDEMRRRRAKLKVQFAQQIEAYKVEKGCVDCGFNKWPEALHFDHRDHRTKLASLGWIDDRSKIHTHAALARFFAHVEEHCDVRCANCHAHRSRTAGHYHVTRTTIITTVEDTLF